MDRRNRANWTALSGKWTVVAPLSPCDEDLAWFQRQVERMGARPLRALLFGVTPGLARLAWPPGTVLAALDWAEGMLRNTLPSGSGAPVLADWRELPLANGTVDIIVGDGCYTALGDEAGASLMNAEMKRVLRPGGLACFRCFARPSPAAEVEALFDELRRGERTAFDLFRWRLAVAVQGPRWGVALEDVWRVWDRHVPDRAALAARQGWGAADLQRIERWKGERASYAFPSLAQLEALAAPHFELAEPDIPSYTQGGYFPRIVLRAR